MGILMTLPNPSTIILWATALAIFNIGYQPLKLTGIIFIVECVWTVAEASIIYFAQKYINKRLLRDIEPIASFIGLGGGLKFIIQFIEIVIG